MMVEYDGEVLQKMAGRLYSQARRSVAIYGLAGVLFGGVLGLSAGASIGADGAGVAGMMGAMFGLIVGLLYGDYKALKLRVEAQSLLCQVEVEASTRVTSGRAASARLTAAGAA